MDPQVPSKDMAMPDLPSGGQQESMDMSSENRSKDSSSPTPVEPEKEKPRTSNYTEQRFASLFNSKGRRPLHPRLPPVRHTTRAKPTLPPFIKSPPSVRVTTEEPIAVTRSSRQRSTPKPTARTTSTTPSSRRGRGREPLNVVSTTESSSRKGRRFGNEYTPRNSTRLRSRSS